MNIWIWILSLALSAGLLTTPSHAVAQGYPNRPITFLVGFVPGGGTDYLARVVGQKLSESLGQPVVVDNRPGAGSTIAADLAAKAAPDGYTILMANISLSISAGLYSKLPYSLLADLAPVGQVAASPQIVTVNPSLPVKSIKELIALAKAKPGQINFGSAGNGSPAHLCTELFKSMAGVDMVHIPYKGGAQAVTDLLGGRIDLLMGGPAEILGHVKAGKLRALAVTTPKRSAMIPDLPTVSEAGVPGYEFVTWFAVFAPARTPTEILERLYGTFEKIMQMPPVKDGISSQGLEPLVSPPKEFAAFLKADVAKWAKIIKDTGTQAN
jgi:tripartite-type tricarboxylate transporter receptor subunit TctC